jgi:hypothetical protein
MEPRDRERGGTTISRAIAMQRNRCAADGCGMSNTHPIPKGVALLLEVMSPYLADGGRAYALLAERVEVFLAGHGLAGQWGSLDVAAFLRAEARTRREKIELCCNLSAILAWIVDYDGVASEDARRIWHDLREHCPEDRRAHLYIEFGAREFAGAGAN